MAELPSDVFTWCIAYPLDDDGDLYSAKVDLPTSFDAETVRQTVIDACTAALETADMDELGTVVTFPNGATVALPQVLRHTEGLDDVLLVGQADDPLPPRRTEFGLVHRWVAEITARHDNADGMEGIYTADIEVEQSVHEDLDGYKRIDFSEAMNDALDAGKVFTDEVDDYEYDHRPATFADLDADYEVLPTVSIDGSDDRHLYDVRDVVDSFIVHYPDPDLDGNTIVRLVSVRGPHDRDWFAEQVRSALEADEGEDVVITSTDNDDEYPENQEVLPKLHRVAGGMDAVTFAELEDTCDVSIRTEKAANVVYMKVGVICTAGKADLDPNDVDANGCDRIGGIEGFPKEYLIGIGVDDRSEIDLEESALDLFHSKLPIKALDNYAFYEPERGTFFDLFSRGVTRLGAFDAEDLGPNLDDLPRPNPGM